MRKTIGVAIAVCNGERYIRDQLVSIIEQSDPPDLISISDDASTDRSLEIIYSLASKSSIQFLFNLNRSRVGVVQNFSSAFSACGTDYISYCDQDDIWERNKIEEYRRIINQNDFSLVFHKSAIVDSMLRTISKPQPENLKGGCYQFPHLPDFVWGFGHQMLFSREVLLEFNTLRQSGNPFIVKLCLNMDRAFLVAAGLVGEIYFIDKALMRFRRHPQALSPAAKPTLETNIRKSILNQRAQNIERHLDVITGLFSHLELKPKTEKFRRSRRVDLYLNHLTRLQSVYGALNKLYNEKSIFKRILILLRLISNRAYGSIHANRIPFRYLVLDVLKCLAK